MSRRRRNPFLLGLACAALLLPTAAAGQLATTGDLLVADAGADAVFVVDLVTGQQHLLASGPPLSDPSGISVDPKSNLVYVTDRSGGPGGIGALIEIDPADGSMVVVSSGNQLAMPEDVIVHGSNGEISVIDGVSGVVVVDPDTGGQTVEVAQTGSAITKLALFGSPRAADRIVVDPGPLEIQRIISSNDSTLLVGQGGSMRLPTGITTRGSFADFAIVTDAGNLSQGDGQVIEVRITNFSTVNPGANQRVVSTGMQLADPLDLVTDVSGTFVYVVDPATAGGAGGVIRVDIVSGEQLLLSSGGSFVNPVAIELYPLILSKRVRPTLYVADSAMAEVYAVDPIDGSQSLVASRDLLVEPVGVVAVPGSADLFVCDRRAGALGAVVKIDASNGIQTLVSEGDQLSNPEALVLLHGGDLLVADSFMPSLVRIDAQTGSQTAINGAPPDLVGVAVSGDGSVYGLRPLPAEVIVIDLAGGGTQTVASGGDIGSAVDLVTESDGSLIVLTATGNVVRVEPDQYDGANPASNQTLLSSGGELVTPTGIGVAPDSTFYITDPGAAAGAGAVVRVTSTSGGQTILSPGGQLVTPAAIASGRPRPDAGDILVADPVLDAIIQIDPDTGDQQIVTIRGLLSFPDGIALDLDGSLLVAEAGNNLLVRVDLDTGAQTTVAAGPDLPDPRAVTVRDDGAIFVGSRVSPFPIAEVDPTSGSTTLIASNNQNMPGGSQGETRFRGMQKLVTDPQSGDLFVSTNVVGINVSGDALRRLDPDMLPLPASPTDVLDGDPLVFAAEMVIEPSTGDVFLANGSNILRIVPGTGAATVVSEGGFFNRAQGLAMDAQGQLLTTSIFGDSVIRVDPSTGAQELVSFSNQLRQPQGIVVMPVPEPPNGLAHLLALSLTAVLARRRSRGGPQAL